VIHAEQLTGPHRCDTQLPDGRWVPARPLPFYSIWERWRVTWLVFTGKADALIWPGQ
jgi:hypothetical protein